ncbi:MAG: immune inhibitor A, partial [Actinobacteria bacterium]|nr:immune inhibitor A [Actinomycetota bacterium]
CQDTIRVATRCTKGFLYVRGGGDSPFDHGYYLEMRDRSGFDMAGHNQIDRDPIGFEPGLLLVYTDETHGYGNSGTDDPPAQSPIDAHPEPGDVDPDWDDATFTAESSESKFSDFGQGYTNSSADENSEDGEWHFRYGCLAFEVLRMRGTDIGPPISQGNLQGDVRFRVGSGCAPWDYGYGPSLTAGSGRAASGVPAAIPPHHRP